MSYENLRLYFILAIPNSFLREELTGWYQVKQSYVENEYGTRFLFDNYGTKWLAFEMEF